MAGMYLLPEIDGAEIEEAHRTTLVLNTIRGARYFKAV